MEGVAAGGRPVAAKHRHLGDGDARLPAGRVEADQNPADAGLAEREHLTGRRPGQRVGGGTSRKPASGDSVETRISTRPVAAPGRAGGRRTSSASAVRVRPPKP